MMRAKLRRKIAGAYAALALLVLLGLGAALELVVHGRMMGMLRDTLSARCVLVRAATEGVEPGQLQARVRELGTGTGTRITIIAPDGTVLADSEAQPATMENHGWRPEVLRARELGLGSAVRRSATVGTDMLYVAQSVGAEQPTVRAAMPLTQVRLASASLRRAVLIGAFVAAVVAGLAGVWLAGGIMRSLDELAHAARRIGEGDLAARALVRSGDEVEAVAEALNRMAEGLAATEAGLQRTASHLRAVLAQMADGVIVVGPDDTVQVFNEAAGALLSTDPHAAVGRRLSEVALHYELEDLVRRALKLRTLARREIAVAGPPRRILAAVASPVDSEEGLLQGAVMSLRDITELQQLQQVRQDFVDNASHELRTPVTAIRSLAETLRDGAMHDPQAATDFLDQIVRNTANLGRLLDDMMALARLEKTQRGPEPASLNVQQGLEQAASRLRPQAEAKAIDLRVEASGDLTVWCPEENLMAALVNVIDNGIKYTPEGGWVHVEGVAAGHEVQIAVTDSGPGIPEEHRQRVFERFYRVDKGRSRALGGTGLGLSIVKHAVESSGGRVWAESPEGGGARFVIVLPARPRVPQGGSG